MVRAQGPSGRAEARTSILSDMMFPDSGHVSAAMAGPPIPPQGRLRLYSSDEWEEFIREWATGLTPSYVQIKRFGGSGDHGADIAAFKTKRGLEGSWDCFQAKHYSRVLSFSDAAPEMLKVFRSVLSDHYTLPDSYQFLAPRGCGTQLNQLLSAPTKLRKRFLEEIDRGEGWAKGLGAQEVEAVIGMAKTADFSLFRSIELLDALETHTRTPYHAARFGTALALRPPHEVPPEDLADHETRYVEQLIDVYGEKDPSRSFDPYTLAAAPDRYGKHFLRQRVAFYKAESLRVYARDSVPPGTFELLEEDVYSGVVDVVESDHADGYTRLSSALAQVGTLDLNRHKLISVSEIDDRKGICHRLANVDRLIWVAE